VRDSTGAADPVGQAGGVAPWSDRPEPPTLRARPLQLLAVGAALAGAWWLLVALGSAYFVLVHVFYLPILMAAFWFGLPVAVLTGVLAGVLSGPLLPPDLAPTSYTDAAWLLRSGFFIGNGAVSGALATTLVQRRRRVEAMNHRLQELYAGTLRGFGRALEMKDSETAAHCERVARNAVELGREMGMTGRSLQSLYWAGYLHDVGKLAIPSHILSKPGALAEDEYAEVQRHADLGAELVLRVSDDLRDVAEGIRGHHERWDGAGYPRGAAGTDIPLTARVLAVVDVFEALTSARPYRGPLPEDEARAMIREESGRHFDPTCAGAFLALEAQGRIHVQTRDGSHVSAPMPEVFDPGASAAPPIDAYRASDA
jgi:hypothetical protein